MNLEDNICPICLYIFIQPVTMPCKHELCLGCFQQNVQEANFVCPMCRIRISTWARRASRKKELVNEERWSAIKKSFPDQVRARLEGFEEDDEEMNALNISIKLAEPGEIREEYEEQLKKLRDQRSAEERAEAEASERLIRQLQAEEKRTLAELEEIRRQDEELAQRLSQTEDDEVEIVTRATSGSILSVSSDSRASPDGAGDRHTATRDRHSTLPSPGLLKTVSPEGGKMFQANQTPISKKIRRDENLITTQDIENLEETFKKNTPSRDHTSCCSLLTTPSQTGRILQRSEILDAMCKGISISVDDLDSNCSTPPVCPKPVLPVAGMTNTDTESTDESGVLRAPSSDSISHELNHFRPIRSCPLTPPRRLPSGQVVEPMVIRTTPRNLSKSGLGSPLGEEGSLAEIDAGSPIMQRRLSQLAEERIDKVNKFSKSTCTLESGSQPDENLNPESQQSATPTHVAPGPGGNRSVDFRDISNSNLGHKHAGDQAGPGNVKKKLIIPLEPEFDTDVFCEGVVESEFKVQKVDNEQKDPAKVNNGRLSRKRRGAKTKNRYMESPQATLMKWAKPMESLQQTTDSTYSPECNVKLNGLAKSSHKKTTRSGRTYKSAQDPNFLYDNLRKKKPSGDSNVANESDNSNSDCEESDSCLEIEEDVFHNAKRRKLNFTATKLEQNTNQNCNKTVNNKTASKGQKRQLKTSRQPLRQTRKTISKPVTKKQARTVTDYFAARQLSREDQEEKDRRMAEELQRQFELEAKLHLSSLRFKGTTEEYQLRQTRNRVDSKT
ncbi:E3 ubiquitin-protein ligase RNF169-like [Mya arenaria]|uniref:E3 ubiquitin-protein ligase RNF169-like n=1 Tax=Mya arenaria TaxID=6604 RepID=UPI0022DF527A|nr:E3 ubiquitin-protein ligase RNF169-like [Mya arenaria]